MRELNEQELEQVAGGYCYGHGYAVGNAEAGSTASLEEGVYGSVSDASVLVTPHVVVAGAGNATFVAAKSSAGVSSSASTSALVVH
jgi:hypothetical protein